MHREPERDVPDTADRSGLWLGRNGGKFEVFDVVSRSPADLAGIEKGDVITAVDGRPTAQLDLFAVRKELRSSAKESVSLTIERNSVSRIVPIALHDLLRKG